MIQDSPYPTPPATPDQHILNIESDISSLPFSLMNRSKSWNFPESLTTEKSSDILNPSLEMEKNNFQRITSSIHNPTDWQNFREFVQKEMREQDRKYRPHAATNIPNFFLPFWDAVRPRASWLVGLMLLQSFSSVILDSYSGMLNHHIIVATFVTTLIGTGGNAGNQASSMVIQAISSGEFIPNKRSQVIRLIKREILVAICMASLLSLVMYARVFLTSSDMNAAFALSLSMLIIVGSSIVLGSMVPLLLSKIDFDPASGAAPILTTIMDLFGILAACIVCNNILSDPQNQAVYIGSVGNP